MSSINIKPYESNLGGNFYRLDSLSVKKGQDSKTNNSTKVNQVAGTLSIQKKSTDQVSTSYSPKKINNQERVENRASNQLLSASLALTTRSSLNEASIEGVNKLKILASLIEKEVNPINKQKLVDEANSLVSSLTDQFNEAVQDDPSLTTDYKTTVILSPGSDTNTPGKFSEISIPGLSSPNDSGLEGIDFTNLDEANDKIDLSLSNLNTKQLQIETTSTDILQNTSLAVTNLKAESKTLKSSDEEDGVDAVVTEVTKNFLKSNSISESTNKNIVEILDKSIDQKDDSEESQIKSLSDSKKANEESSNAKKSTTIDIAA